MLRIITFFICMFITSSFSLAGNINDENWDPKNHPEIKLFIQEMVKKYAFNDSYLTNIFRNVKVRPMITSKVKYPIEQRPWYIYQHMFLTQQRIIAGVQFWKKYQTALDTAQKQFGVPANIIVATIGIETKYGNQNGKYPVIDALVNLAFTKTLRAVYFRRELIDFLLLTREQHLDAPKIMGSYAGAIGQPQFMPSSYRNYAVNFSGNRKIDLSNNEVDVIGSIANYYKKNGWKENEPVAIPVSISGGEYQISLNKPKPISLSELLKYNLLANLKTFDNQKYKLVKLQKTLGNEYWLTFHNFDVIKRYNHSELYAMSVYQLSYYITAMRGL